MVSRTNRPAKLVEHLEEVYDGDLLDGIIANYELKLSKTQDLKQPLEKIHPDNSEDLPKSEVVFDADRPKA